MSDNNLMKDIMLVSNDLEILLIALVRKCFLLKIVHADLQFIQKSSNLSFISSRIQNRRILRE